MFEAVFDEQLPRCWRRFLWKQIAAAFEGPYWPKWDPELASLSIPNDGVSLQIAKAEWNTALLATLPDCQVLDLAG